MSDFKCGKCGFSIVVAEGIHTLICGICKIEMVNFTPNPDHNIIVHPGGGGFKDFKPTHRLFLSCSATPDNSSRFDAEKIKNLVFPFSYRDLYE